MNSIYKEIGSVLKDSGYNDGLSFVTENVTGTIKYISIYTPSILLYSKVESIKKILHSYNVSITSNSNIECITIKVIE